MPYVTWNVVIGGSVIQATSGEVNCSYRQAASTFAVSVPSSMIGTVTPYQNVSVVAGLGGVTGSLVSNGLVDEMVRSEPDGLTTVRGRDKLKYAIDYWLAPTQLGEPALTIHGGSTFEATIRLLLETAQTPGPYSLGVSGGSIAADVGIEIMSVMDCIVEVQQLNNWKTYVQQDGTVTYADIRPFGQELPSVGTVFTGGSGNIYTITRSISDDWLRNRIVVFGSGSFLSVASGSSPYLPVNFYKTGVIGVPNFAPNQTVTDAIAATYLVITNRLTERVSLSTDGNASYWIGKSVIATDSFTGTSGSYNIYTARHRFGPDTGYLTELSLVR